MTDEPPPDEPSDNAIARCYLRLLKLPDDTNPEALLDEALQLIVDVTGAQLAYIELRSQDAEGATFVRASGDIEAIRGSLSTGIVEYVIRTGATLTTASAFDDARFTDLASVRRNQIAQVLVAPVGTGAAIGVVYMQSRANVLFTSLDKERVEAFARQLAPIAARLIGEQATAFHDQTQESQRRHLREALNRQAGNVAATARDVGISRSHLYSLLRKYGLRD